MSFRSSLTGLALAAGLLATGCEQSGAPAAQSPASQPTGSASAAPHLATPPEEFDFYVLALSWSPSYCEAEGEGANPQQCSSGRPYAFVVHGLWPQFERGFPSDCPTDAPRVADEVVRSLNDIMPSAGLIGHQWRRHGSCTGLTAEDYFATLRAARQKVAIPAAYQRLERHETVAARAVEQAFLQSNQELMANGVATTCDRRYFREVRICMTKSLEFRSCPELDRRTCRADKLTMPPVRGG
jgi:ribonuclease T2